MSKEEKEAIEYLNKYIHWETFGERNLEKDIKTLLNLIEKYKGKIEYLQNSNRKYVEDNISLLRNNGKVDVLADNLHYKYIDNANNFIPKQKIKDKMEYLNKQIKNAEVTEAILMIKQQQVLQELLKEE